LDGEEYDNKKDKIIKSLSNGKSIFVISVYRPPYRHHGINGSKEQLF